MRPIPEMTTEAAFDLMEDARQLRTQADRWYRLGRFMVDEKTLKALADLAEEAEAEATLREGELQRTAAGQSYLHGIPTSYAIEPGPNGGFLVRTIRLDDGYRQIVIGFSTRIKAQEWINDRMRVADRVPPPLKDS
jgi:hypothetical protein